MKQKITHLLLLFAITVTSLVGQDKALQKQDIKAEINRDLNNVDLYNGFNSSSLNKTLKPSNSNYGTPPNVNKFSDFGGSGYDNIKDITSDDQGYVYVTGSFSGELTLDGTNYTSVGDYDLFIAMFDSNNNGKLKWFKHIPSSKDNTCIPNAITLDENGEIYITGSYTGSLQIGDNTLASGVGNNLFYAHFDNNGLIINSASHNKSDNEYGLDIITDSDRNVYITVSTKGDFQARHQSWLLKFNNSANLVSEAFYEVGFNEMKIKDQNIYFIGSISKNDNPNLNNGVVIPSPKGYNDVFVVKSDLNLNFEWVVAGNHSEADNGDSISANIDIDEFGNIYIIGTYRFDLFLGGQSIINSNQTEYSSPSENFVAKINPETGNVLWLKSLESDDWTTSFEVHDNMLSIVVNNNNFINLSLDGALLSEDKLSTNYYESKVVNGNYVSWSREGNSIYLTQLSDTFVQEWKTYLTGTSSYSTTVGTVIDKEGNIYNCFTTSASIDYNGVQLDRGTVLSKLDKKGKLVWLKQFPNTFMNTGRIGKVIDIDTLNSSIVLTGMFYEELQIPGGPILLPLGMESVFISKFDLDGNHVWSKQEDMSVSDPTVDIDVNGNIYLTGSFNNSINIGNTSLTSKGYLDAFIAKYKGNGDFDWVTQVGGDSQEYVFISDSDQDGFVYLTGEFISENIVFGDTNIQMLEGDGNIFVAKINTNGDLLWNKTIAGGPENQDYYCWPTGIVSDNKDNIFIKGWIGKDNMFGGINLTSDYNYNKFVTKIDKSDGTVVWANPIREINYSFGYNSFSVDNEGSVYLGSEVRGEQIFFGDDFTYSKTGVRDAFIAKYLGNGTLDWVKTIQSTTTALWINSVVNQGVDEVVVSGRFSGNLTFDKKTAKSVSTHSFISLIGSENLSVEDIYNKNDNLTVYPNPTKGNISISLNNLDYNKIEIISLSGVVVDTISKINNSDVYNLSNIARGVYILKVYSEDNSYSQRLIIE